MARERPTMVRVPHHDGAVHEAGIFQLHKQIAYLIVHDADIGIHPPDILLPHFIVWKVRRYRNVQICIYP